VAQQHQTPAPCGIAPAPGPAGPAPGPAGPDTGIPELRAVLDGLPQIIWSTRPDGFHDFYNARWYAFTGTTPGSTDGDGWNGLFHPDDQARAWARWRHSLETGEPYEIEYRLRRHDGTYGWVLGRASPIRDAEGRIRRWMGTCTDIEALKAAEALSEMIARELQHRIRNIFAVVNSLLALSSRHRPEAKAFATGAQARIEALARAHEYIRPSGAAEADGTPSLQGLLRALLAPYDEPPGRQVEIEGTDVAVGTGAATSLALVLHELATNAVKHGALSQPAGRLRVTTRIEGDSAIIDWMERGGPPISGPPQREGFGTMLSARALKGTLSATLEQRWDPDGLAAGIRIPLKRLAL
jgi:PAS domain S-box-containing protein